MMARMSAITLTPTEQPRLAEVRRLTQLGGGGVPELIEMLADPSWGVRRAVVAGLAALGDSALLPLCETLRNRRDSEARIAATVDALVASKSEVLGELSKLAIAGPP